MTSATSSLRCYFVVYVLLLVGLTATVGVAYLPLEGLNGAAMIAIASAKATLVVLYFMHVRQSPRLIALAIASGLVWLAILLTFVLSDYYSRPWTPVHAPGSLEAPASVKN
jgi:cytochrome c oxidase subunit 4